MKLYERIQAMSEQELRVWVGQMQDRTRSRVAKMGGEARAARLTPEERSAIARKAGKAGGRGRKATT